jgi:hypothetical protein
MNLTTFEPFIRYETKRIIKCINEWKGIRKIYLPRIINDFYFTVGITLIDYEEIPFSEIIDLDNSEFTDETIVAFDLVIETLWNTPITLYLKRFIIDNSTESLEHRYILSIRTLLLHLHELYKPDITFMYSKITEKIYPTIEDFKEEEESEISMYNFQKITIDTCSVCFENTKTKTSCHHSLCYICMCRMYKTKRNPFILCPICREHIHLITNS